MLRQLRTASMRLLGIEGHVHGPARDDGLLAPGAKQLIGRDQVVSGGLLAQRGVAFQDGKDAAFLCDQGRPGQGRGREQRSYADRLIGTPRIPTFCIKIVVNAIP